MATTKRASKPKPKKSAGKRPTKTAARSSTAKKGAATKKLSVTKPRSRAELIAIIKTIEKSGNWSLLGGGAGYMTKAVGLADVVAPIPAKMTAEQFESAAQMVREAGSYRQGAAAMRAIFQHRP
jgi:hypothetical protein